MQWKGRRQSGNVEDRRGFSGRMAGGGIIGVITIVIALFLGVDPSALLQVQNSLDPGAASGISGTVDPAEEQHKEFIAVVLADTEDVWNQLFQQQAGKEYRDPTLVLFSEATQSGCGFASAASGPFYCPPDEKVYIDLQFFDELQTSYQAAGDFAEAYVIAHEVGHHVQNQLGVLGEVHSRRGQVSEEESNEISVRTELQADFLAGVWAHHAQRAKNILEPGDLEEALGAASAVGDDRLQRRAQGYVVPDSFTHGTSEQRVRWFRLGFETGDLSRLMDPFKLDYREL
jgi:predicted metalloprotease